MTAARTTDTPKIFRITLEVSNIDEAAAFYTKLLGLEGKRHPGARHYFDCGGVMLSDCARRSIVITKISAS